MIKKYESKFRKEKLNEGFGRGEGIIYEGLIKGYDFYYETGGIKAFGEALANVVMELADGATGGGYPEETQEIINDIMSGWNKVKKRV